MMIMFGRAAFAAGISAAFFMTAGLSTQVLAEPSSYCGGQYPASSKYWMTTSPSASTVLGRLPNAKRTKSGNITTLSYQRNKDGSVTNRAEFDRQWQYIFGTSRTTGYGKLLKGKMPSSANTSWGKLNSYTKHNLSECVVGSSDTAICMGIPSGTINVSSLGHHSGWTVIDPASLPGKAGSRACIVYDVMFSSNFKFLKVDGKLPGLTNATGSSLPPNDHLCSGTSRIKNTGSAFSTRPGFTDGGGSTTMAALKLGNNFKNDMIPYDCKADGDSRNNEFATGMHAQDVTNNTQTIKTGVWYRLEHELVLNDNYATRPGTLSGAESRVWLYQGSKLVRTIGIEDSFRMDANRDGSFESYPLMPRTKPEQKITGIFMSIQQGGNLTGKGPWTLDHVIALRNFALLYK